MLNHRDLKQQQQENKHHTTKTIHKCSGMLSINYLEGKRKTKQPHKQKEFISRLEIPMALSIRAPNRFYAELPEQVKLIHTCLANPALWCTLMYHKCAHESHNTCEHLQILSTSKKVLGIQNLDKPVPSGSNLNVYTVINYI